MHLESGSCIVAEFCCVCKTIRLRKGDLCFCFFLNEFLDNHCSLGFAVIVRNTYPGNNIGV